MKRIITLAALAACATSLSAMSPTELIRQVQHRVHHHQKPVQHQTLSKQEQTQYRNQRRNQHRSVKHERPQVRHFKTLGQYRQVHRKRHPNPRGRQQHHKRSRRHAVANQKLGQGKLGHYVGNGWYVDDSGQYDEQYRNSRDHYIWVPLKTHRQHAYRHYRRQWYLTYLYERAEFNDRHGYHYGYFDRFSFMFDGEYYQYDRAYTYQDRLHGKGLFEHRFYRPARRYASRRRYSGDFWGGNFRFEWKY